MSASPDQPADLVLRGGRIATMDAARRWASALAVRAAASWRSGRIEAVAAHIGPSTRVIELRGRTVTPGFQDAHVHPVHGGLARLRCELHDTRGREAYLAVIAEYARSHPDESWIRGGGWYMDDFPGGTPRREDLDAIVPDRPVFLTNRDGHGAWVNSRALELAGVDGRHRRPGRRPDRARSRRLPERHAPRGRDGPRRAAASPTTRPADLEAALRLGQAYLHSLGITAWQDAIVRPETEERAYVALAVAWRADGPGRRGDVVGAPPRRRADRGVRRAPPGRPRSDATRRRA